MHCAVVVQVKKASVSGRTPAVPLARTPLSNISNVQVLLTQLDFVCCSHLTVTFTKGSAKGCGALLLSVVATVSVSLCRKLQLHATAFGHDETMQCIRFEAYAYICLKVPPAMLCRGV